MPQVGFFPTLEEVYPAGVAFSPVAPSEASGFLHRPRVTGRDASTAQFVPLAGDIALIVSAGAVTREGIGFLESAGVPVASRPVVYRGEEEYAATIRHLASAGVALAFQHRHWAPLPAGAVCVVPPDLLSFLNNKASLAALVPPAAVPRRELIPPEGVARLKASAGRPLVLKGCTPLSSGSAGAVVMARDPSDLEEAQLRFAGTEAVAVEEHLDIRTVWCLNFATTGGEIHYLGTGEQITAPDGRYLGNWFGPSAAPPGAAVAIGHEVMAAAVARGYAGFAGFDVALTAEGRLLVLDLNFRVCGSTPPLRVWETVANDRQKEGAGRCLTLLSHDPLAVALAKAREACQAGWILPVSVFDPAVAGWSAAPIEIRCLVVGPDRDAVSDRLDRLSQVGLGS